MNSPEKVGPIYSVNRYALFAGPVRLVIVLLSLLALGGAPVPAEAGKKPGGGGGGPKPGTAQILPLNFGTVQGCQSSQGLGLSAGDLGTLTVVGSVYDCEGPSWSAAARWHYGLGWQTIPLLPDSAAAAARGVSDDGTVVGWMAGTLKKGFVLKFGDDSPQPLVGLYGKQETDASSISKPGNYIVGTTNVDGLFHATAWARDGSGAWQPAALGAIPSESVFVPAVSDQGTAVVNVDYRDTEGRLVTEAFVATIGAGGAVSLGLNFRANDIDASGNWVVGFYKPCAGYCPDQTTPVFWTRVGNGWSDPQPLPLAGSSGAEALGVAVRSGRLLVVGQSYPQRGSVTRALAWVQGDGGGFTATQLAAIDGKSRWWAVATDVNENGFVTGWSQGSSTGYTDFGVLWRLP